MARFYSNENIANRLVEELRRVGHDVVTSADAGNANAAIPDTEVLAFAVESSRILLTYHRSHFLRLHDQRAFDHAGMVLCRFDPDFVRQAKQIGSAVSVEADMKNRVLRINRPG